MLNKCRYYAFEVNGNLLDMASFMCRRVWYHMVDMLLRNGAYPGEVDTKE